MDRHREDADCHDAEDDSWLGTGHLQHNDQSDTVRRLVHNLGPCSCCDRDRCVGSDCSSVHDTLRGMDRGGWNKDCVIGSLVVDAALWRSERRADSRRGWDIATPRPARVFARDAADRDRSGGNRDDGGGCPIDWSNELVVVVPRSTSVSRRSRRCASQRDQLPRQVECETDVSSEFDCDERREGRV